MIVVKVELHSAITGKVTEIARAHIFNDGTGSGDVGNYVARTYRGRSEAQLDKSVERQVVTHEGVVTGHRRKQLHVWNLVAKSLKSMGYG